MNKYFCLGRIQEYNSIEGNTNLRILSDVYYGDKQEHSQYYNGMCNRKLEYEKPQK